MKTKQSLLKVLTPVPIVLIFLLHACSKDESPTEDPTNPNVPGGSGTELTITEVLARGVVEDYPVERVADTLEVSEPYYEEYLESTADGDVTNTYFCTTKKVSVLDGNGQFPLFNPNAEMIWPGNLLQGKTLSANSPSSINVDRAGGTVSINLLNGNSASAITVDKVTKGNMQIAMNEIIANDPNIVPANFQLEVEEVYSQEQMALELGVSYESYNINASANLSFSNEKEYNRVLVKLTQQYYTMSMDQINGLDDIFAPEVTGEDLSPFVQADNPATFISSVTYGRIFYMLVESTSSVNELRARVEGTYQGLRSKIEGEIEYDQYNALKEVKTKIIAYGGSAQSAFSLTGELDINTIGEKLAESTNITEALPLSYVVKSVLEPSKTVGTKLATEYDAVICSLRGARPPQGYSNLVGLFEDGVGAATAVAGSNAILFNGAGTEYVWFNGNTGNISPKYSINDGSAPLGIIPFDALDSATLARPGNIFVYDKNSNEILQLVFDQNPYSGNSSTIPNSKIISEIKGPVQIEVWHNSSLLDGETFPLSGTGFDAVVYLGQEYEFYTSNTPFTITGHNEYTYDHGYFQKGNNNSSATESYIRDIYETRNIITNNVTDSGINTSRKWSDKEDVSNDEDFLFSDIGAACSFTQGNTESGFKLLYFSSDGKSFFIRNGVNGDSDGPYVID
ncbi:thiol-activated cytolysin family protein [Flagellimonas flava]|uniref:thiol-activated cytolysin family protein n=1 Tax=Flagellimonas TaxID=444459 RepID=UPI003D65357D